jgi:hypothetical protein
MTLFIALGFFKANIASKFLGYASSFFSHFPSDFIFAFGCLSSPDGANCRPEILSQKSEQ